MNTNNSDRDRPCPAVQKTRPHFSTRLLEQKVTAWQMIFLCAAMVAVADSVRQHVRGTRIQRVSCLTATVDHPFRNATLSTETPFRV